MTIMEKEKVHGVFTVRGFRDANQVKIKHLANMTLKPGQQIPDEKIEEFDIVNKGCGKITGTVFKPHISNSYLMSSKKLPVLSVSVINARTLTSFMLYRIIVFFTITQNVKTVNQLLKEKLNGTYSLELQIKDNTQVLDDALVFYGRDELIEKLKGLTMEDDMKALANDLADESETEFSKMYAIELDAYKVPDNIVSLKDIDTSAFE